MTLGILPPRIESCSESKDRKYLVRRTLFGKLQGSTSSYYNGCSITMTWFTSPLLFFLLLLISPSIRLILRILQYHWAKTLFLVMTKSVEISNLHHWSKKYAIMFKHLFIMLTKCMVLWQHCKALLALTSPGHQCQLPSTQTKSQVFHSGFHGPCREVLLWGRMSTRWLMREKNVLVTAVFPCWKYITGASCTPHLRRLLCWQNYSMITLTLWTAYLGCLFT